MKYIKQIGVTILVALCFLYGCKYLGSKNKEIDSYKEQVKELTIELDILQSQKDSLAFKVDSLYEIKNKIDTVYEKQVQIYEKTIDDILTQSTSDDILFFSRYLSENPGKWFISSYHKPPT